MNTGRAISRRWTCVLGVLLFVPVLQPPAALARGARDRLSRANSPSSLAHQSRLPARSPSSPAPLPTSPAGGAESLESAGARSPADESDPLVSNGLGSPSCRSKLEVELAAAARRNCETSGFVGAAAPTGNYGIDVHIDTGVLGLSSGGLLSTVQDLLVTPVWMAIVWVVHSLIVMLEWCFTLDLLEGDTGLAGVLAAGQRYLTSPWLPLALSIAAVLLAYEGLVRRRVAESLGQAVLVLVMIAGGLWVMLNPAGTLGALSDWTNQAGLGTLAVAARGTPVAPGGALGAGMDGVFAATVESPWCYLEFGDVRWCREPSLLDGRLKEAGIRIAGEELSQSGCSNAADCSGSPADEALARSARLLREAQTNGALFLALPSDGPARNSINSQTSLLHALCQSEEATNCSGPTAAQAEFRTNSGTWSRVGGLLLISIGVLGMILLLGHIGLRLLMAAMLSLFYLLLAPGVVLAPAFGERGRDLFRAWAVRLFGAVVSKLVFAFLLGVVLAVMAVIGSLGGLGWWTQWLLLAAFWWGVFLKRNQILAGASRAGGQRYERVALGRRAMQFAERPLRRRVGEAVARRRSKPAPESGPGRGPAGRPPSAISPVTDDQAMRMLAQSGGARPRGRAEVKPGDDGRRAQLERIRHGEAEAEAAGDTRRGIRLALRRDRMEGDLRPAGAEREASRAGKADGGPRRSADGREQSLFLDAQARLPSRGMRDSEGRRRDYATLAPLAGLAREEYERLGAPSQRSARLEIDRELASRRERISPQAEPGRSSRPSLDSPQARGGNGSVSREPDGPSGPLVPARRAQEPIDEVWQDMREVGAGRKRQLGIGRP